MAGSTSLGLPSIIDALLRILSSLGSPSRGADRNHPSRLSPIPFKVGGWGGGCHQASVTLRKQLSSTETRILAQQMPLTPNEACFWHTL